MSGGKDGRRGRRRKGNFEQRDQGKKAGSADALLPVSPQRRAKVRETPKDRAQYDKNGNLYERPRWTPPQLASEPPPALECGYCGKPIRDAGTAMQDKYLLKPVHFDCVIAKLGENETLERGDVLSYIGGGRFGIVHFTEADAKNRYSRGIQGRVFTIKKILEWEDRENRADWRNAVADRYSLT